MATTLRRRDKRLNNEDNTTKEESKTDTPTPPTDQTFSLDSFLSRPVNSLNLALFRLAFGLLMSFLQFRALFLQDILEPNFKYAEMNFHFYFATGIPKLPFAYILALYGISSVAALCMGLGLVYRASCGIFLVIYTYLNLIEKSRYNNHFYLYILLSFFFLITDAHRRLSVDSMLSRLRNAKGAQFDSRVPFWQYAIFRFQLFVVYFYAGLAKLNYDWLFRFEPMTIWSSYKRFSNFRKIARIFLSGDHDFVQSFLGCFFSLGGVLFDLFVGFFLLIPALRPIGLLMAVFFHLSNHFLFKIGTFPWVMMATNVLFIEQDAIPKICDKILSFFTAFFPKLTKGTDSCSFTSKNSHEKQCKPRASPMRMPRLLKGFLVVYVVIQLLVPFRHWLYPGNVNWTLEGHQFSWRMMLNEEDVIMRIDVEEKTRNYTFDPFPLRLTKRQVKRMLTDPELVVQLVRHIKAYYVEDKDAAIKVDMWKGLNDRPYQRYIYSHVDLSTVNQKPLSYDWIIPQLPDDVIDFHKIKQIKRHWLKKRNDVMFFMEAAGQEYRTFMQPHYCDNVRLFSLNSQIHLIVGSTKTAIGPRKSVTVPSNVTHTVVTNSHTTSIWYYVFDCHVALFHESMNYVSDKVWKFTHFW